MAEDEGEYSEASNTMYFTVRCNDPKWDFRPAFCTLNSSSEVAAGKELHI